MELEADAQVQEAPIDQPASTDTTTAWPTAPGYRWDSDPRCFHSREPGPSSSSGRSSQNFFRSARWCHDGSSVLTTAEDRSIRVFDTPVDGDEMHAGPSRTFAQPDAINATQWYPSASTSSPATFCFMASIRDTPVRLVDATDGRVRATYPIVDHRERCVAPHCLAFNPTATKVYCGHENAIEVLDISTPGHDTSERLKTTSSRKEPSGQRGIISSIAFSPDYSGTFAAASFNGSISIYSEDTGSTPISHLEGVHPGGVTHMSFHPLSPTTLFVGSRRSPTIQVYDMRDVTAPVAELSRSASTNQRLWFDVDPWGRYLASGDEHGMVKIWDISDLSKTEPIYQQQLSQGSVQLHPFQPILLTTSGSRRYLESISDSSGSEDSSDESTDSSDDDEPRESSSHSQESGQPIGELAASPNRDGGQINTSYSTAAVTSQNTPIPNAKTASLKIWSFA